MPEQLALRYTSKSGSTSYQVFRNNNGTFSAFGDPIAAATLGALVSDSALNSKANLVIQFGDEFYAAIGEAIAKFNPATNVWDSDLDYGTPNFALFRALGFFIGKGPTGAPRLVHLRHSLGNIHYTYIDTPGGTWITPVLTGITTSSGSELAKGVMFNNEIFFYSYGEIFIFNIATLSLVKITNATLGSSGAVGTIQGFVRAKDRMFVFRNNGGVSEWTNVFEYLGGSFTQVIDGSADEALPRKSGGGQPGGTHWIDSHYDTASDSLIVHAWQQGASVGTDNPGGFGWLVTQIPLSTLVPVDITSTVLSGLGVAAPSGISPNNDVRWSIEVDTDTDPLNPITYIWVCVNDGSWARYRWNGIASPMTALGSGGSRSFALTHNPNGGGQYVYDGSTTTDPSYHVEEVLEREPIIGGTRIFLTATQFDETGGTPTPDDVIVGVYFGTTEQTPSNLATLAAVAKVSGTGSDPVLNTEGKIANFTADGTTIYSADWLAVGDGLINQQRHMLMPHVEL